MGETVFNPLDEAFLADPHAVYAHLREHEPVHRAPVGAGVHLITRYEDVKTLVRDTSGLAQAPGYDGAAPLGEGPATRLYRGLMVLNDPPVHSRLRKLAEVALTGRAVGELRPRVEEVVTDALDAADGEMDAIADLGFVIPLRVICGMLGIPESDRAMLLAWTPDFFRIFLPAANDEAGIAACHEASQNFIDYLGEHIEHRRKHPTDDIFGALVSAEAEGDRLSHDELVATVLSMLTGGFDTTMGMIGAGVYTLARQPEQLAALREDPEGKARAACEEFLRWESPVQVTIRHFDHDVTLHDMTIPAGDPVWLALASANRDGARFDDPDRIDVDRPDNKHLAFGGARHFCIGNHLARLEGEVAFAQLARRWSALELAGDAPRRPNFLFRSIESLPVRFEEA